jgi:L-rhamnose isomerase
MLVVEKHQFSERYSDLQGDYEDLQEKLDRRKQKYQQVKREME